MGRGRLGASGMDGCRPHVAAPPHARSSAPGLAPKPSHQPGQWSTPSPPRAGAAPAGAPPPTGGSPAPLTAALTAARALSGRREYLPIQMDGRNPPGLPGLYQLQPPSFAPPRPAGAGPAPPPRLGFALAPGSRRRPAHSPLLSWPPPSSGHMAPAARNRPAAPAPAAVEPLARGTGCYRPGVPSERAVMGWGGSDGQGPIQFKRCGAVTDTGAAGRAPRHKHTVGGRDTGGGQVAQRRARRLRPQPSRLAAAGPRGGRRGAASLASGGPGLLAASLGGVVGVQGQHPVVLQALGKVGRRLLRLPLRLLHDQQHLQGRAGEGGAAAVVSGAWLGGGWGYSRRSCCREALRSGTSTVGTASSGWRRGGRPRGLGRGAAPPRVAAGQGEPSQPHWQSQPSQPTCSRLMRWAMIFSASTSSSTPASLPVMAPLARGQGGARAGRGEAVWGRLRGAACRHAQGSLELPLWRRRQAQRHQPKPARHSPCAGQPAAQAGAAAGQLPAHFSTMYLKYHSSRSRCRAPTTSSGPTCKGRARERTRGREGGQVAWRCGHGRRAGKHGGKGRMHGGGRRVGQAPRAQGGQGLQLPAAGVWPPQPPGRTSCRSPAPSSLSRCSRMTSRFCRTEEGGQRRGKQG